MATNIPGDHLKRFRPDPNAGADIDHESPGERAEAVPVRTNRIRWSGLVLGIVAALLMYFVLLPDDLAHGAKLTAGIATVMAIWWMTEALPIPATALVPLLAFPVLNPVGEDAEGEVIGVGFDEVGASYGNNIIFLFMGGFFLALAMQRWNLHRRIALHTVRIMGTKPTMVVAGFMIATGFLSMWVSNTATAVMMLPIGVSVLMLVSNLDNTGDDGEKLSVKDAVIKSNFGTALMLGIAYAASLGSLSTIIGTPPNTFMVGYLKENYQIDIGFGQWMLFGLPISIVFLVTTWFLLTKVFFKPEIDEIPGGRELMTKEIDKLGKMSTGEKLVLGVFGLAVVLWIALPAIFSATGWNDGNAPISDAGIAMLIGLLLFAIPAGAQRGVRLLNWESATKLPWGVLLLFGGGLALSAQFGRSGLTQWVGEQATVLAGVPLWVVIVVVVTGVIFLTELTSNTATAASVVPLVAGLAIGIDVPVIMLVIPVALAATCAFMLPVATPPNAIAYGSGYVTVAQMVKGGFWLNIIGIVILTVAALLLIPVVFASLL